LLHLDGRPEPSRGTCRSATAVSCTFASIERGTTRTVTWHLRARGPAGARDVTGFTAAATSDPTLSNNRITTVVQVKRAP
jgi:hypothetical protein